MDHKHQQVIYMTNHSILLRDNLLVATCAKNTVHFLYWTMILGL